MGFIVPITDPLLYLLPPPAPQMPVRASKVNALGDVVVARGYVQRPLGLEDMGAHEIRQLSSRPAGYVCIERVAVEHLIEMLESTIDDPDMHTPASAIERSLKARLAAAPGAEQNDREG